jgi:hypothetical protein
VSASDRLHNHGHAESDLTPAAPSDRDPRAIAREQFVHGLLGFLHHDDPRTQTRRVAGVMAAIDADHAAYAEQTQRARMTIHTRPAWRVASGLAAAAAVAAAVFISIPTAPAVATLIDSSLAVSKQGVDRRYQVRVSAPNAERAEGEPIATIDTRGGDRMVARATTPRGERVAFGRDAKGDWNLVPGGEVERVGASSRRPSWVDFGESTIMMESMDAALERLKDEYDAKRVDRASATPGGAPMDRVSATLKTRNGTSPERLELWIDPTSRLVERLEMHWAPRPRPDGRDGRGPLRGPDGAGRPGPGGPEGMPPGPPPPRGPRGPQGPAEGDARHQDPDQGPQQGPPRDRRPGPDGGPRPDGPEGFGAGPDGPGGPGGGGRGGPRGPRPMHAPPDFARHAPPPRVMVITRIDVQPVTDDWFSPEAHTDWAAQARGQERGPDAPPPPRDR